MAPDVARLSVAPMLDCTDRHYRYLARMLTRRTLLYSEMVVDRAVLYNHESTVPWDKDAEQPVALQLGGSGPERLAQAARIAVEQYGYDEVNLNVGCPSPRVVQKNDVTECFGARLMLDPPLVAECCRQMREAVDVPVTVKCRIGVDDQGSYDNLQSFIDTVAEASGVEHFIIHARIALLKGLTPEKNRSIPPLRYEEVYKLLDDFPRLRFSLNGGVNSFDEVRGHLDKGVHGVMVGRWAYREPWALCEADELCFGERPGAVPPTRRSILERYVEYCDRTMAETPDWHIHKHPLRLPRALAKPILGLFHGQPGGGNNYRTAFNDAFHKYDDVPREQLPARFRFRDALNHALSAVDDRAMDITGQDCPPRAPPTPARLERVDPALEEAV